MLKSTDPPILSVFFEWAIQGIPPELCTEQQLEDLLNLLLSNHYVPVRSMGQSFVAYDDMAAFKKAFTRTRAPKPGELIIPGSGIFWINTKVATESLKKKLKIT